MTGAAARVGRSIALEFARAGFDVAIHYRTRRAEGQALLDELRALGADAFAIEASLDTAEGCSAVVDAVRGRWDKLHALVNNASQFEPVPFADITLAHWEAMQAINVRAPFLLAQGLLPLLYEGLASDLGGPPGQGGCVVNLCDIGAERPVRGYAAYSVSKAGIVMLTRAMAVELAPRVRAIGISPGQVAWPEDYDVERRARIERRIPLARVGAPEDVARVARFAVCEGFYLNGAIVPVDGGLACRY